MEPTVFIVDDDPAVRRALSVLVRSMGLRAEACGSAQEFLAHYDPEQPGCVLLDVRMPGVGGLELLERFVQEKVCLPVIIISAHGDVPMVVRAMRAGALNFLEKPCRDQQLWEAVQEGLRWDAECRKQTAYRVRVQRRIEQLSQGERAVLDLLVEGKTNREIAGQLGMSVRTIEVRRGQVMRKMRAESLAELVRSALAVADPPGRPMGPPRNSQEFPSTNLPRNL